MTRLAWDISGERTYEAGVDRGVLYPQVGPGVVWDGLVSVRESPKEQASSVRYIDGRKYHNSAVADSFEGTIEAFTYPEEFTGDIFGLCYRTMAPTDENPDGYRLHLVYNAVAEPSSRSYSSVRDSVDLEPFAWDFTTTPIKLEGLRPSAHFVVDGTKAHSWVLEAVENVVYGDPFNQPRLPTPGDLLEIFESGAILRVIDHGDGTWTAIGPDEAIQMINDHVFQITWPSALFIDEDTWTISSL